LVAITGLYSSAPGFEFRLQSSRIFWGRRAFPARAFTRMPAFSEPDWVEKLDVASHRIIIFHGGATAQTIEHGKEYLIRPVRHWVAPVQIERIQELVCDSLVHVARFANQYVLSISRLQFFAITCNVAWSIPNVFVALPVITQQKAATQTSRMRLASNRTLKQPSVKAFVPT
jgi:hypothetical protein